MSFETAAPLDCERLTPTLQTYLLGVVEFEAALALQRRLVFEVAGDRGRAALILCEHNPPLITVGRHGSRAHLLCGPEELRARQWSVRWVNRGGGCLLHLPGQLAIYPVLPLDRLGLGLEAYLKRLQEVLVATLDDFGVRSQGRIDQPGVWVSGRLIAGIGVAVRDWVTYYGAYLNINPPLDAFRLLRSSGPDSRPMTSLERERRGPLRPSLARERLLEHFAARFPFTQTICFTQHPSLSRKTTTDAFASRS
jgi:lipoyl(octanoyl) transferase